MRGTSASMQTRPGVGPRSVARLHPANGVEPDALTMGRLEPEALEEEI